eukprot:6474366-Pyramimonas_sp.AAC.1
MSGAPAVTDRVAPAAGRAELRAVCLASSSATTAMPSLRRTRRVPRRRVAPSGQSSVFRGRLQSTA